MEKYEIPWLFTRRICGAKNGNGRIGAECDKAYFGRGREGKDRCGPNRICDPGHGRRGV